jgi:hypothetical protein
LRPKKRRNSVGGWKEKDMLVDMLVEISSEQDKVNSETNRGCAAGLGGNHSWQITVERR